jgi:predicted component of type VI protein secretion system
MDVKLVVHTNGKPTQTFQLRSSETIVGRQKGCGLRVPSSQVSRRHCLLSFKNDLLSIQDLTSANGTFVNGRRITRREYLRPGDKFKVGPVTLLVQYQLTEAAVQGLLHDEQEIVVHPVDDFLQTPDSGDAEIELVLDGDDNAPLVLDEPITLDPVDDPLAALQAIEDKATAEPAPANPTKIARPPAPEPAPAQIDDSETETVQLPPPKRVKLAKLDAPTAASAEPEEEADDEPAPDASQILGQKNWQLPTGEDIRDILAQIEKGKKKP